MLMFNSCYAVGVEWQAGISVTEYINMQKKNSALATMLQSSALNSYYEGSSQHPTLKHG